MLLCFILLLDFLFFIRENTESRLCQLSRFSRGDRMPRKRSRRTPYKPYENHVDLTAYHRLTRFLRWMNPGLSPEDVLRMLPESETWPAQRLRECAEILLLASAEERVVLVPYLVTGYWGWPVRPKLPPNGPDHVRRFFGRLYLQGTSLEPIPRLPPEQPIFGEPVLLAGHPPDLKGLCQVAADVRQSLRTIMESGPRRAFRYIATQMGGGVVRQLVWSQRIGEEVQFAFKDTVAGNDFRVYCFWLLAKLLAEGHVWRMACCVQCGGCFLKTRRDPSNRPSRFCGEHCRRAWHNPRRSQQRREP
jgi:hypothetical protein